VEFGVNINLKYQKCPYSFHKHNARRGQELVKVFKGPSAPADQAESPWYSGANFGVEGNRKENVKKSHNDRQSGKREMHLAARETLVDRAGKEGKITGINAREVRMVGSTTSSHSRKPVRRE